MSYELEQQKEKRLTLQWSVLGSIMGLMLVILVMYGCPKYNVYKQRMEGQAQLAHAQSSKEVAVAEAKAKMESSALLAQADTIRAHGIAKSNEIIGNSLKNNKAYLNWLWIDNLKDNENVIYIPTESNLPILEAGRGAKGKILGTDKKLLDDENDYEPQE